MTNDEFIELMRKHSISGLRLANHFDIPRQQVYAWINKRHKIGKAWQLHLIEYFENLGK